MLLRFTRTDMISAAGGAAKVPSRVGEEQEAIINETHLNGTAIDDLASSTSENLDSLPETVKSGADSVREAYYNAGSAAIILLLLLAVGAIFFCLRARLRKDAAMRPDLGYYEAQPQQSRKRKSGQRHRRGLSSMSSARTRPSMGTMTEEEEPHELEELNPARDADWQHEDIPSYSDKTHERNEKRLQDAEEVFSLGDSDDEQQQGDIGRQA